MAQLSGDNAIDGPHPWQGALTLQRVVGLKQELFGILDELDKILLSLTEGSEGDPTCLQVLCSGHRAAALLKKELALAGSGQAGILPGRSRAGRNIGCDLGCDPCPWQTRDIPPGEPR